MDKLEAVFACKRKEIDYAIEQQNKRCAVNYEFLVKEHLGITVVLGLTHEVMYLIGELAANGNGSLYSARSL